MVEENHDNHESHGEHKNHSKKKSSINSKLKSNPWILSTLVFGILAVVLILTNFAAIGQVSKTRAADSVVDYVESVGGSRLEYSSVNDYGNNLYQIVIDSEGQEGYLYVTKDGKFAIPQVYPIVVQNTQKTTTTEIPKSDVPDVELYIWSYCPYGVTAQSPFADVAELLGDYANFKINLYYAGHGDFEVEQNKIQACMQELNINEYWEYSKAFVETIYPVCNGDVACDLEQSTALMNSLGINSGLVLECVDSMGESLLDADYASAGEAGVTGSPTLVVNGMKVSNVARTAEAFKDAVCSSFTDGNVPEACGETLSSDTTTNTGSAQC
ncbi:MAG: hypothetical protein KC516_03210 [Nanoarchaeota archaeon]|nr:hypothetical protein [Nanoarchaeota archaeon]